MAAFEIADGLPEDLVQQRARARHYSLKLEAWPPPGSSCTTGSRTSSLATRHSFHPTALPKRSIHSHFFNSLVVAAGDPFLIVQEGCAPRP